MGEPFAILHICKDTAQWVVRVYRTEEGWTVTLQDVRNLNGRADPIGNWLSGRETVSGTFQNGKALVKWVTSRADRKFGADWRDFVSKDTLSQLERRSHQSLVPSCYVPSDTGGGRSLPQCGACPYASKCGEVQAQTVVKPQESPESDQAFLERLREKVARSY